MTRATVVHDAPIRFPLSTADSEAVRSELRGIVSSPYFRNSKRYPAFLNYIVEKTILGEASDLKERTIGIEVFGRPVDYDTNTDPIVRNSASEVRKRLSLYHLETPSNSPVSIHLPLGSYHPEFRVVDSDSAVGSESDSELLSITAPAMLPSEPIAASSIKISSLVWFFRVTPLLLLLVGGILWWVLNSLQKGPTEKLWQGFLDPSQTVLIGIPQAPAPASLDGPFMKGPLDEKDISNWIKDNPDVAAEDLSAIIHATKPLMEHDVPFSIHMDSTMTLTDLRDRPVILIGGPSNVWTMKLLAPLRFHFNSIGSLHIEDSQNPQSQQWRYVLGKTSDSHVTVVEDCSIIARFHDPTTGGIVMVLAGAGRNGTEAAGEFVTSDPLLKELNNRLPSGWKNRNVEIVLKTKVIEGHTGSPSIEATHVW